MQWRRLWMLSPPWLLVAGACSSEDLGPPLPPCSTASAFAVSLAVTQYVTIDPAADSGCVAFVANGGTDTVEYLLLPMAATGTPGVRVPFRLIGADTAGPILLSSSELRATPVLAPAERFHAFLREWEGRPRPAGAARAPAQARTAAPPPVVGHVRQFSVCNNLDCSSFAQVTATAQSVGQRLAIYVDNAAPANGLNAQDLDTLKTLFDTRLYGVDTAAFGRESDVDGNTVVIVLMTNKVNSLVTDAECVASGFVSGFFFGADIDPRFAGDSRFNHGEVFYTIVADPAATLSCAHSRDQVKRVIPVTFVHEFQHMISFNQHVLVRGGDGELLWLNEGLSHFAEELGGRSFLPGDQASFSRFLRSNVFNAYSYLDSTGAHFLLPTEGFGTLAERGSAWLFVRFLVDRFAADTTLVAQNALTRALVATNLVGDANVATQTGQPFAQTVSQWGLANWVSDLPAFTTPTELKYRSWSFRTTFQSANMQDPVNFPKPYPLVPTVGGSDSVNVTGHLPAGSGVYHRVLQLPGGGAFLVLFGDPNRRPVSPAANPRLNVIRIR